MSIFNYKELYDNGINSHTQLRRSTDMINQRGGTYEVVLTGDTYVSSMELDVDLFSNDEKVGRMSVVPYDVVQDNNDLYTYRFNIRPYEYLSNYIQTQHYTHYYLNDWYLTNETININNPYPNNIKVNFKYGYKFLSGSTLVTEYSGSPSNDLYHYTDIPFCNSDLTFSASGFTNTGNYFDYIGGVHQMNDRFMLQNFDQELGTVVGTGFTINTVDIYRRYSPMSQFLMDYPTVPQESETSRFLTDAPRIQTVQEHENYVLYYLNGQTGDRQVIEADWVVFELYDENNVKINYLEFPLNYTGSTYESPTGFTDNLQVFSLPVGPRDISNIFEDVDWSGVSYYTAQICYGYSTQKTNRYEVGAIGPLSEVFYFYLYDNCGPEDTRLCFLNSKGGYDYFTFTKFREDSKKITRNTYDNRYYATNLSSPDRDLGRTIKTFNTEVEREFVIESDYLSETMGQWLEQLFYSPQVYEMREDFISPMDRQDKVYMDLRPVQVSSTEVKTINTKHQKLNKYRITCKYADSYFVQKGF